ncbi:DJ-1/PfpI family protein [Acetobacteraceae bacterium H6797]|nr:DJ-1/PfpI family protein [Acetobacteraceae bacterium H6797]
MSDHSKPLQIGFVLFPALTQLDLTGPWEVLIRVPGAQCHLLHHELSPVRSESGGLTILPTTTYADCPPLDMVIVPGGPGHLNAMEDERLLTFLRNQAPRCRYVMAVCTGALVLGAAGLLRGYRATTHWMSLERLAAFGATPVNQRVVFDRDRVTGGGVTAGIDFGLAIAAELAGEDVARAIQLQIEYEPKPPYGGSPDTAGPETVARLRAASGAYRSRMEEVDGRAAAKIPPA